MSELAPAIVERIRGVLLQGSADREALQRLADAHAREVGKVNTMLARCQRWVQRGCASEALSLAEAAHLIPAAAALRLDGAHEAWNRLLHAAGLPPAPEVDVALLEALVAAAGKQESLVAQLGAMRHAFLRRAPLQERLAALHALADREPRNPAWLDAVRRLEREAVAALADAAREAVRAEDTALAGEIVDRLDSMALRGDEHAELFGRVRRITEANLLLQVQRDARRCAERLHAAAAAMDFDALAAEASAWQALCARGEPGESLRREVEGPLDLWKREQDRRSRVARQKTALDQLELALDQARDVETLDRLAEAADRLDAEWPAALRSRLRDRREQHALVRTRRRALIAIVSLILLSCLIGAGWWVARAWAAERRFDDAIAEADRRVEAGELDAAAKVIEAVAQEPANAARPELSGARLRIANARDRARAAEAGADEIIARLDRMRETSRDPVEMEMAAREASGLLGSQPASRRDALQAAIARLQAAGATARDRSIEASRGAFHALTARLTEVADPQRSSTARFDRAAWIAAAESLDVIAREARTAASTAAAQRDGQAAAEALQGLATEAAQRASQARGRADRLEMVRGTLQKLEQTTDEQATLDLWEKLLREGGDVLAERGMLRSCEAARDTAASGLGIRAWRSVVVPGLLAGRGDSQRGLEALDWGDAATARARCDRGGTIDRRCSASSHRVHGLRRPARAVVRGGATAVPAEHQAGAESVGPGRREQGRSHQESRCAVGPQASRVQADGRRPSLVGCRRRGGGVGEPAGCGRNSRPRCRAEDARPVAHGVGGRSGPSLACHARALANLDADVRRRERSRGRCRSALGAFARWRLGAAGRGSHPSCGCGVERTSRVGASSGARPVEPHVRCVGAHRGRAPA